VKSPVNAPTSRGAAGTANGDGPRHIVLVTWDTVRADVLPLFGGGGLDTPNLARLAREGITFDRATAVAPITGPAHLSLLTGLYPPQHGLRSNGDPAPPATGPHLAELLRDDGFETAGFVSNLALMRRSGFDRGFDHFDDRPSAPSLARFASLARLGSIFLQRVVPAAWGALAHQTPGDVTLARAKEWLVKSREPSFLWTHFYDAHAPYDPREPFASRTRARASEGLRAVDPRAQADVVAQRGEVEELDALLGELRAALEQRDPDLAHTLLIVVADHGECFGEGGLRGHHQSLLHATQHIPLVIRLPSGDARAASFAGTRVPEPVSQIDLLPTIAAALGLWLPPECEGLDLLALATSSDPAPRGLYLEAFQHALGPRRLQGWTESGWKYLRDREGHEKLLRLDEQGAEQSVDDAPRRDQLRARLDAWLAAHPGAADDDHGALSNSDAEALKALGYGER
jgi:arylsulfatase A-like enzyme